MLNIKLHTVVLDQSCTLGTYDCGSYVIVCCPLGLVLLSCANMYMVSPLSIILLCVRLCAIALMSINEMSFEHERAPPLNAQL